MFRFPDHAGTFPRLATETDSQSASTAMNGCVGLLAIAKRLSVELQRLTGQSFRAARYGPVAIRRAARHEPARKLHKTKKTESVPRNGQKIAYGEVDDACHHFLFHFAQSRIVMNSNEVFILRYTWSLATPANKREFRLLLATDLAVPTSPQQPYAAAIGLWLRIPAEQQQLILSWMDERLEELGLGVQLPDGTAVTSVG